MHQPVPHNAPLCNRNVHACAHFCYEVVHSGIYVWCFVRFVRWVNLDNVMCYFISQVKPPREFTLKFTGYPMLIDPCALLTFQMHVAVIVKIQPMSVIAFEIFQTTGWICIGWYIHIYVAYLIYPEIKQDLRIYRIRAGIYCVCSLRYEGCASAQALRIIKVKITIEQKQRMFSKFAFL